MKQLLFVFLLITISICSLSAQKSYKVEEPQYFSLSLNTLVSDDIFPTLELQTAMHLKKGTSFYIGGGVSDASFSFDQFLKFGVLQRIVSRRVISIDTGLGLFYTDTGDSTIQLPVDVSFILGDRFSLNTGVRFGYTHFVLGLKYDFVRSFDD